MTFVNRVAASWDLLDPEYHQDFNGYGIQTETGFVYPLDYTTPYTIQSFSEDLVADFVYPMDKTNYNLPPPSETSPTDVFQTVPSTTYNTPAPFDYPLFETFDTVPLSDKSSSPALLHPTNIADSSTFALFDPLVSDLTLPIATTHECNIAHTTDVGGKLDALTPKSRKRRQPSESSQSDANADPAKRTRIVKSPQATAKVRVLGACLYCKRRRTSCREGHESKGPCLPCLELAEKVTIISGLLRPLCWRPPKLKTTELFRKGPTIDFAASLRGRKADSKPGKQAVWDLFATGGSKSKQAAKVVQLSQHWTSNTLSIELQRYAPLDTDKQHYTWHDDGVERHYDTPAYGIANWRKVQFSIERFMEQNFTQYIDAHLQDASEISRTTFEIALEHKHLHLVDRALKIWVGCRFIEEPWSIVSHETLSMSLDPNPASPYHSRIPVPPIVDMQIDLIVINSILQPLLKETLAMMTELLESSAPWKDWFEIYLAYFVILHNVELTMAHDAWFVRRHNLKTKYSNTPLIQTIMQGATTLLSCFHYAHQGYAPFTNPKLEETMDWTAEQRKYVRVMRVLLGGLKGECVSDPGRECFWTSQLGRGDWRPVTVVC